MSTSLLPPVPDGFKAVKERNAIILLPLSNTTFLNPIQEYNRDLSVAVIKRYMKDTTAAAKTRYEAIAGRKAANRARKTDRQGGLEALGLQTTVNTDQLTGDFGYFQVKVNLRNLQRGRRTQ